MRKVFFYLFLSVSVILCGLAPAGLLFADSSEVPESFAMYRYDSDAGEFTAVDYFAGEAFDVYNGDIPYFGFISASSDTATIAAYEPNYINFPSDLNWAHWMGDNKTRHYSFTTANAQSLGTYGSIDYEMSYYTMQVDQAFWDTVTPHSFWMAAAELKDVSSGNTRGYMSQFTVTPEPVSVILFLCGGAGLLTKRVWQYLF